MAARTEEYRTKFANPFVAGRLGFIDDVVLRATPGAGSAGARDAARQAAREPVEEARQHPALDSSRSLDLAV